MIVNTAILKNSSMYPLMRSYSSLLQCYSVPIPTRYPLHITQSERSRAFDAVLQREWAARMIRPVTRPLALQLRSCDSWGTEYPWNVFLQPRMRPTLLNHQGIILVCFGFGFTNVFSFTETVRNAYRTVHLSITHFARHLSFHVNTLLL